MIPEVDRLISIKINNDVVSAFSLSYRDNLFSNMVKVFFLFHYLGCGYQFINSGFIFFSHGEYVFFGFGSIKIKEKFS